MLASAARAVRGPLRRARRRARRGLHARTTPGTTPRPRSPRRASRSPRSSTWARAVAGQRCARERRRRRAQRVGGDGDRRRPAGLGGARRRTRWRRRDDRRRPAARLRRLEPGDAAVARHRRRPALRRATGVLRPRRRRPAVALDRGRRGGRGADERAVLVHARPTTCPGTSSTCSATRPSPTCSRPSATTCASTEHVKRATYIGTAIDQGRTSGVLTAAIVNQAWGDGPGAQGPTNRRPPYTPVPYAVLAGRDRGPALLDPIRTTPIHDWHVERGAVFENVGQWKRPWYFPRRPASRWTRPWLRECLAVRNAVGVLDASTLGKIEVVGPDAAAFLDRHVHEPHVDARRGLDPLRPDAGARRHGVRRRRRDAAGRRPLLRHHDDGRGRQRCSTTFEEWLQTEWPDLRVYCTSVTEQWATVAVNGPRARERAAARWGPTSTSDAEAFPFMTLRDGTVAGMPARVARVSFTGELAYEINVAGWLGRRDVGGRDGGRRTLRASRRTAPRRCTCCAPRRGS